MEGQRAQCHRRDDGDVHGRAGEDDEIELAMSWNADQVRLEVVDEGPGFQVPQHEPDRPGGWGLALVETMSDRWGIERGDRTRVWFELGRAQAA